MKNVKEMTMEEIRNAARPLPLSSKLGKWGWMFK